MSNDSYTEVTTTSFMQRIGNSIKGIFTGLLLILVGTVLLYWNEGRSVREAGAIAEAELVSIDMPNIDTVDPSYNGKVVYAKGEAKTSDIVTDAVTGVSANAIKIEREVMFYQWVENTETTTIKNSDGSEKKDITYTYEKEWTYSPIDSSSFKIPAGHQNKTIFTSPLKEEVILAKNVTFGAYKLPEFFVRSINNSEVLNVELTKEQIADLKSKLAVEASAQVSQQPMNRIMAATQMPTSQEPVEYVHINANEIYLGANQASPKIGDVKISYIQYKDTAISLIAKVSGNTFDRFVASNGHTFSKLSNSQESKEMMFQGAKDSNSMMTWILRVLGVILVIGGISTVLAPLAVVADIIPLVGEIVAMGTGLVATLLGLTWSFIIIGIAWIRFRPTLAFALIGVAIVFFVFIIWKKKSKKNSVALAETAEETE